MAKKASKKAKKSGGTKMGKASKPKKSAMPAKKPAKKSAAKASKPAAKVDPMAPVPVNTGSGRSPMEIGKELVEKFNAGKAALSDFDFFSPKIVSCEGMGVGMEWRGRAGVDAKNAWWSSDHTIHGASAEGPFVGSTGFAVKFCMDVETKSTGARETMEEVGVYTVNNGQVVREEFMYVCRG